MDKPFWAGYPNKLFQQAAPAAARTSKVVEAWTARVEAATGQPVVLDAKIIGQLKRFGQACYELRVDPLIVIGLVVDNWAVFAAEAAQTAAQSNYPETPHAGFLLKHRELALASFIGIQQ